MRHVRVDFPAVTQDQALELMAHHLQLAYTYFEAISDDDKAVDQELKRLMIDPDMKDIKDYLTPAYRAAVPWLATLRAFHERLHKEHGE